MMCRREEPSTSSPSSSSVTSNGSNTISRRPYKGAGVERSTSTSSLSVCSSERMLMKNRLAIRMRPSMGQPKRAKRQK